MPTLHTRTAVNTTPREISDTGAMFGRLSTTTFQPPTVSRTQQPSVMKSLRNLQTFLPASGIFLVRVCTPRWPLSLSISTEPRNTIHTKRKRETSSEKTIPELKP